MQVQRAAKRQCGRSQRVIKVPDTQVFEQTSSYLARPWDHPPSRRGLTIRTQVLI
jgi:hypothetical protein